MPPVDTFMRQSGAVLGHDATAVLSSITAPTLITFGEHDMVTSTRFAGPLTEAINDTELIVFSGSAHAPIYEITEEFNQRTLEFLAVTDTSARSTRFLRHKRTNGQRPRC